MRTSMIAIAALTLAVPFAAPAGAHPVPTAEERAALFAEADADGDGKLGSAEFAALHELVRQRMVQRRFEALDTDDDGAVTSAELDAGRAHRAKRRRGHGR